MVDEYANIRRQVKYRSKLDISSKPMISVKPGDKSKGL